MNCHWLLCKVKKINFKTKHIQMENCRFHYGLSHSMAFHAHCRSDNYQQITTNRRTFNLFKTIFEKKKIRKMKRKGKQNLFLSSYAPTCHSNNNHQTFSRFAYQSLKFCFFQFVQNFFIHFYRFFLILSVFLIWSVRSAADCAVQIKLYPLIHVPFYNG